MDFREKIKNDLKKAGYDILDNNVIDDLIIHMLEKESSDIYKEVKEYKAMNSLKKLDSKEEIKKYAENFFIDVDNANRSTGVLRMYFEHPTDIFISEGKSFTTEGKEYLATRSFNISSEEMTNRMEGYYFVDIEVQAQSPGKDYDLYETKDFLGHNDPVSIFNPYSITGGSEEKSPSDIYQMIKQSISTRNLANEPATANILQQPTKFPTIKNVRVVGAGEDNMQRDIIELSGYERELRVGNMKDVWFYDGEPELQTEEINNPEFEDGKFKFGYDETGVVVLGVKRVVHNGEEIDFEFKQKEGYENSIKQESVINPEVETIESYEITYAYSKLTKQVQDFLLDKKNRMPLGDPLAKKFVTYRLSGIIRYIGDIEDPKTKVRDFFRDYTYNPHRSTENKFFEVSDLIEFLHSIGAQKVQLPMELFLTDESGEDIKIADKKQKEELTVSFEVSNRLLHDNPTIQEFYSEEHREEINIEDINADGEYNLDHYRIDDVVIEDENGSDIDRGYDVNNAQGIIKFEEYESFFYTQGEVEISEKETEIDHNDINNILVDGEEKTWVEFNNGEIIVTDESKLTEEADKNIGYNHTGTFEVDGQVTSVEDLTEATEITEEVTIDGDEVKIEDPYFSEKEETFEIAEANNTVGETIILEEDNIKALALFQWQVIDEDEDGEDIEEWVEINDGFTVDEENGEITIVGLEGDFKTEYAYYHEILINYEKDLSYTVTYEYDAKYDVKYRYELEKSGDYTLEDNIIKFKTESNVSKNDKVYVEYEYPSYELDDEFKLEPFELILIGDLRYKEVN